MPDPVGVPGQASPGSFEDRWPQEVEQNENGLDGVKKPQNLQAMKSLVIKYVVAEAIQL